MEVIKIDSPPNCLIFDAFSFNRAYPHTVDKGTSTERNVIVIRFNDGSESQIKVPLNDIPELMKKLYIDLKNANRSLDHLHADLDKIIETNK